MTTEQTAEILGGAEHCVREFFEAGDGVVFGRGCSAYKL